ncbi:hypothetical protein ES702_04611 [subsurface metagenome]
MDIIANLSSEENTPITCIDMHTTGEPTRIVIKGYPELTGTLLQQRAQARKDYDHIRRRLMLEPRGHYDMYGALLRPVTEHTVASKADMGVLFMTNDGYSTMCGHATIALGRFLVDTHDPDLFPERQNLKWDPVTSTTQIRLHAPCGVVEVTVPTSSDGKKSDPSRPVSFVSIESFATGLNITVPFPRSQQWPSGLPIVADFAYGGAFYCLVSARELRIGDGLRGIDIEIANRITRSLKAAINNNPQLQYLFQHPTEKDLSFLYSIILVDYNLGEALAGTGGSETGLCYFADQQVDRSPTGSGVSARLAAAYARGWLKKDASWTYNSLVSAYKKPQAAFKGTVLEEVPKIGKLQYPCIRTRIEGYAFYTGYHTFCVEPGDVLGDDGFTMYDFA